MPKYKLPAPKPGAAVAVFLAAVLLLLAYAAFAETGGGRPGTGDDPLVTQSYVDGLVRWQVAELKAGQTLTARAGAEFIVRRGTVRLVDPTRNGVPDLTAGLDLAVGERVTLNHLLVFPRDDGRGIRAVDSAVVMYRGGAGID